MTGCRVACALTVSSVLMLAGAAKALPSFEAVRSAHRPSDFVLLDRHGTPIESLRTDPTVRRLAWVALEDMSPALRFAILLSEDQRFLEHSGIDWAAVVGSAWSNLWNTRTRGASTVTMQLAGLLDDDLARPAGGRGFARKLDQALTARRLEVRWRKSEILEAYLNLVPLRGELVGVNALAQTLFGKWPSGLDEHEAAITAALVRAPNARDEAVARRACVLLQRQALPCTGVLALTTTSLARRGRPPLGEHLAPHFARHWWVHSTRNRAGGSAIQPGVPTTHPTSRASTIDAPLQRVALAALRRQLAELAGRNVEDGAVVVLDNASGDVLAWVGSSGPGWSSAADVDGVLARRQPGSALKPFVYQLAFEQRLLTPASVLDDAPTQIGTVSGLYEPQNYDRAYQGRVSARTALGSSLNIPAVRVGALLGVEALLERINQLGLALPEGPGHYGLSLALGGADVTLLALTNAYRTLANGGRFAPPRVTPQTPNAARGPAQVGTAASAFLVTDILADNNARARSFGLASQLATRGFAAVKTGTSKDMRDNWCLGFTDRFTVGVWVGNAGGSAMHDVSGISGAAPVWQTLVNYLHAESVSHPPAVPRGVVGGFAVFAAQTEAARPEWFIAGTGPAAAASASMPPRGFGIASPRDGSVFALDPDMPGRAQRIRFEGEAGQWLLNGKRLGAGPSLAWAPWPGRHVLTLLARDGQPAQTVHFEVRGAGVRGAGASAR